MDRREHIKQHLALGLPIDPYPVVSGQHPSESIRLVTLGDSIAGWAQATSGAALYASSTSTPNGRNTERMGGWMPFFSGGLIRPVYDAGVSGETTTQIAARAVALTGGTKPLVDAVTVYGCKVVVITGGINDISSFTAATAQATIDTAVNLAIANLKICVNAAKSLGLYAFYTSILPMGVTPLTADQLVVNTAANRISTGIGDFLAGVPSVGEYYDAKSYVAASDGGWISGYHDANATPVHPNHNGSYVGYKYLAQRIVTRFGNILYRQGLPKGQNMWSNADMSASSGGLATDITVPLGTPATSLIEWRGVTAQQFLFAAGTNLSGSAAISVTFSAAGAAPFVSVGVNDILSAEMDLYIDDNAGGAPELYNVSSYLRKSAGATATIYDIGIDWRGGSSTVLYTQPLDGKAICGHILIDEATGASSGTIFIRLTLQNSVATSKEIRVIISNIRPIKISSVY